MDEMYVGKFEQILWRDFWELQEETGRVLTKLLEREKEKDRCNCCSENATNHLYGPSILVQGQLQWLQRKKIRLVSWRAFCIDQNMLLKTVGSDTVVNCMLTRGLNNRIPHGGPKKKLEIRLPKFCGEISHLRKSYKHAKSEGETGVKKHEPAPWGIHILKYSRDFLGFLFKKDPKRSCLHSSQIPTYTQCARASYRFNFFNCFLVFIWTHSNSN